MFIYVSFVGLLDFPGFERTGEVPLKSRAYVVYGMF